MGIDSLRVPTPEELDAALDSLACFAAARQPAERDVSYWAGCKNDAGVDEPWRIGADYAPITDPQIVADEERLRLEAEEDDSPSPDAQAERLWRCGVRVDFLLLLTFELGPCARWVLEQVARCGRATCTLRSRRPAC